MVAGTPSPLTGGAPIPPPVNPRGLEKTPALPISPSRATPQARAGGGRPVAEGRRQGRGDAA
eukprot:7051605-Alexandrium_andersonii.AAC.1